MAAKKSSPKKIQAKKTNPPPKKPPKTSEVCVYTNVCDITNSGFKSHKRQTILRNKSVSERYNG